MLAVVCGTHYHLSKNLTRIVRECGIHPVRTYEIERLIKELKQPGRVAIIDMRWKVIQEPGVLKRCVNLSRILANKVICICPNRDEKLKQLAREARPTAAFIRYELETSFRQFLMEL